MPELPEVEILVNELRPRLVGRQIVDVQTDWPKYVSASEEGSRVSGLCRRPQNQRELSASLRRWDRGVKFLKFCVGADAKA